MALTLRDIAVDMDSHVRYLPSGKSDEQVAYQVATINRSLEEVRVLCPQEYRTTVDITWTPGVSITTAVSGASVGPNSTLANYAAGCSVNVDTDASFNEIATVGDGSTAATLLFPFSGTSGSHPVTLYGDCVKLDATVDRVLGCELLHERRPLQILNNRAEWLAFQRLWAYGYGYRDYGSNQILPNIIRQPGVPRAVWIEACLNGNALEYRAHCAPLPNAPFRATLDVATMADAITADDISTAVIVTVAGDNTPAVQGTYLMIARGFNGAPIYAKDDNNYILFFLGNEWKLGVFADGLVDRTDSFALVTTSTSPAGTYTAGGAFSGSPVVTIAGNDSTRPVPGNRVYGILRAICLWHWSGSPWFRNDAARKVIEQEYVNATQQTAAIRPSGSQNVRIGVQY